MPSQNSPNNRSQQSRRRQATQRTLDYLTVRGFYTTAYAEIVQPERVFAVTHYFRRYWVPLLKPGPAWLVVALRQRCYWNQQRTWCVVSRDTLARECGASVRTVDNYLNSPWLAWFLHHKEARYHRTSDGQKQRDWSRYHLHLDEPLTPLHQAAVAAMARQELETLAARQKAPWPTSPLERALEVVHQLLDLGTDTLWQRIRAGERDPALQEAATRNETAPRSLQAIVEETCQTFAPLPLAEEDPGQNGNVTHRENHTTELRLALSRACDALYNRIVRPDKVHIATQYFRLQWLPLLGAARAWLIVDLRARCYFNHQDLELRDTCTVAGLAELAARLGVSVSTVKTCIAKPPGPTFVTRLVTRRPGRGQVEMDFQVEMIEPLTAEDQHRYKIRAASDQMPEFAGSFQDQEPDSADGLPGQEPGFASSPTNQKPKSAGSPQQEPECAAIRDRTKSQDLQGTKLLYTTFNNNKHQQPKVLVPNVDHDTPLPAAVGPLANVLDMLNVHGPTRAKILHRAPPVAVVLAWLVEAFAHEHIEKKVGFVISMLCSDQAPPSDLVRVVSLPVKRWIELAVAIGEIRLRGQAYVSQSWVDDLDALSARLGHLAPEQWPIVLPLPAAVPGPVPEEVLPVEDRVDDDLHHAHVLWDAVLQELQLQMTRATFDTWLRGSRVLTRKEDCLIVGVRHAYAVDWLQNRLMSLIERTLVRHSDQPLAVQFTVLA